MKTKLLLYTSVLLFVCLQGCSDGSNSNDSTCLSISSMNISDGTLLNGGQYRLLDENNTILGTYTLNNGTVNINNLPNGKYYVEEIISPNGYTAQDNYLEIVLASSGCKEAAFYYVSDVIGVVPPSINLSFIDMRNSSSIAEYNAVLIGEYYWVSQNFTHKLSIGNGFENDVPITQELLDRYVERVRIDPALYQLSDIENYERYYGRYYSYPSIDYMNKFCYMANEQGNKINGWKLPSAEDYRQLFAMCPFNTTHDGPHTRLNERDVRFALSAREGDNPMAFNINQAGNSPYKVYWFDPNHVNNMYGFNMMPGGARLNGDGPWCNGLGPNGGCYNDGKRGDVYHLFYTADFAMQNSNGSFGAVIIHDKINTSEIETYHYLNVRWCRPLSDIELGYKLYINSGKTDIQKLGLDEPTPVGYSELPRGYLRGFYVQYMLNNPNPSVTVQDLVQYANSVDDNAIG